MNYLSTFDLMDVNLFGKAAGIPGGIILS